MADPAPIPAAPARRVPSRGARLSRVLVLATVAAAGLLIWVKLRIVAQVPRSVLAEPQSGPVERPQAGPPEPSRADPR
ncbi:MAG: hypothetical protein FJ255_02775 [Phycisphaerae bacterium]|nr:hypothetical protein [Phycisphaerae bacterium]